ncbi:Pentatricopeptide repeat-containing protein [Thalictrum thalictroides]|uniref:Pentatricopeptide repeat-containing protein n=1 Tax=Thalictrum thalictroides TaxID=46969 RepID=A0A7J6VXC8_THATH|nr:Pentatricopeptide repeat-containing protein [Thalictrum thalictroides]
MKEAYELFLKMPERNCVTYTAMITGFARAGMLCKAEKVYYEMPLSGRDPAASNALVYGYLKMGKLEEAVMVFENMVERDVVSWSSMIDGYCKKGMLIEARELFQNMPERNVVSWTTMISGYMKAEQWEDGFRLFILMRSEESVDINSTTLAVIFDACSNLGKLKEGIQVHGLFLSMGFGFDVFLGNSIINMYCRAGFMDDASKIFSMMTDKDVVSWNCLIAGYVQNDGIEQAYKLFRRMPKKDIVSWTTIIAGLSSKGRMGECITLFNDMPKKDDIAWTAVISGFVNNGDYEKAFLWFINMLREAVTPNTFTLSSILGASAGLVALDKGQQIHAHAVKMNMESDLSVQNSLISMYAKCGNVSGARCVFTSISEPNLVSINSMITGLAQHGFGEEALQLFKKMQNEDHKPNQITFLGVLSACNHVGLVKEGWDYLNSMSSIHGIDPGPDHYACMVDLFGRAGMLKEAVDLVHSMPCDPHQGVWGALLSASRTYMDLDLAKLAATHLFRLDPDNASTYAVLSNIYSALGLKEDVAVLRKAQKAKGVRKNPGCSWL